MKCDIISYMEIWKDITDHPGYQVSNLGRVKRLARTTIIRRVRNGKSQEFKRSQPEVIKKQGLSTNGQLYLKTMILGKSHRVHRLVAEAFIPNPGKKPYINHIDGNPQNNRVENLEWCTAKENSQHAVRLGLMLRGSKAPQSKLTDEQVLEIRKIYIPGKDNRKSDFSQSGLAKKYGVSKTLIRQILKRRNWSHI